MGPRLKKLVYVTLIGAWLLSPTSNVTGDGSDLLHSQHSTEFMQKVEDRAQLNSQDLEQYVATLYHNEEFTEASEILKEVLTRDPLNRWALKEYVFSCQKERYRCGSVFDERRPPPPVEICEQSFDRLARFISKSDDLIVILWSKPWRFGEFDNRLRLAAPAIISHFTDSFLTFHVDPSVEEAPRMITLSILIDCAMPEYGASEEPDNIWVRDFYEKAFPRSARSAVETFARNLVAQQNLQMHSL